MRSATDQRKETISAWFMRYRKGDLICVPWARLDVSAAVPASTCDDQFTVRRPTGGSPCRSPVPRRRARPSCWRDGWCLLRLFDVRDFGNDWNPHAKALSDNDRLSVL